MWLDEMPLAQVTGPVATPSFAYVHTGQNGEPLMVTDAGQGKLWDVAVDPWGNALLLSATTIDQAIRYPGQWRQAESGLFQNWMRDYDPTLGRYIETDPIGLEGGSNPYLYVEGNPLNWIDPEGLQSAPTAGQVIDVAFDWWWQRQLRPSRATPWGRAWGAGELLGTVVGVASFLCTKDDDNHDECQLEKDQEEKYCRRQFSPIKEAVMRCYRRAEINYDLCRRRMPGLPWWSDADEDGFKQPKPPRQPRRR